MAATRRHILYLHHALKAEGSLHAVTWRLCMTDEAGRERDPFRGGRLLVTDVPDHYHDLGPTLEMLAGRYLLWMSPPRALLAPRAADCSGLTIAFSQGAARKAILGQGRKSWLTPHARPYRIRARHAGYKTCRSLPEFVHKQKRRDELEHVSFEALDAPLDALDLPGVGRIRVTRHALDRLWEAMSPEQQATRGPWQELMTLLTRNVPVPSPLSHRQKIRKAIKHGNRDGLRCFAIDHLVLHTVPSSNPAYDATLVTIFDTRRRARRLNLPRAEISP